ncbi:MAG: PPOX class F420-dependent oxidoreductase [Halioglobus sp.]|nr:PPOX class F420-dependent oxidoreductase [Halioglobus sp.]
MTQSLIKREHEAVLATTVIGCLSTVRHNDGRVSTNPVSYLWNGTEFEISSLKGRMKYRNLLANPQATLCVVSAADPMHYVEVRGSVRLVDDPDRGLFTAHFRKVSGGVEPPEGMDPPGAERVMLFLTPEQVSSPKMYGGQFDQFEDKFKK